MKSILDEDKVSSTIHFINRYVRMSDGTFRAKKCVSDYYVMKDSCAEKIVNYISNRNAKSALVIDDAGLQVVSKLVKLGVKNITLCLVRINKKHMPVVSYMIKKTFPEININIIHFEELKDL